MTVLSSLLRRVVYPAMSGAGMFARRLRAGEVGVLTYHGLLPDGYPVDQSPIDGALVSREQFRRHLRFLKSRYALITPEAFRRWLEGNESLPPRAVLLTCDDGLLNVLTDMVPILHEEGVRCLFFVTGTSLEESPAHLWYEELYRMIDSASGETTFSVRGRTTRRESLSSKEIRGCWGELLQGLSGLSLKERESAMARLRMEWRLPRQWRLYDPSDTRAERRHRLLNRSELRQLVREGMTVGAHSMGHPVLARMRAEEVEPEIRDCCRLLEAHLQQEIWAFAYPFGNEGSAGPREMKMAEGARYKCAFLNFGGGRTLRSSSRFALSRAHVTGQMDIPELEAHLTGFHERLQSRVRGGGPAEVGGNSA